MNCYLHPETTATGFCRSCGRPLCALCQRPSEGTLYCQDHVPQEHVNTGYATNIDPNAAASNPYGTPAQTAPPVRTSPGLAFVLGIIPGVGAIYNGQYLKGLVHALIFGLLITLIDNANGTGAEPLLGIFMAAFVFYMPFEAYHTAKRRQSGLPVDEWSSIMPRNRQTGRLPLGPLLLIAIGVIYLLNSLELLDFRAISRFWPVILIVVGAYMLYSRFSGPDSSAASRRYTGSPDAPSNNFVESRREQ
ncbi:MAG TPA: DUF5668 domain-containing protein [Bryobacteraceae bacterium]|jgi:TM2 domain-containing membrane protein YozV